MKIIILFVLLKTSILSQSSNYFEDSLKIDIKFNFEKLELEVAFINTGVSDCKLPWKEHFPYSDFDNEVAAFNIYIGFENQIKLLKITENIPTFVFEEDNLNIKAGKTVIKVIQLKPLLRNIEINDYEFIYVQYSYSINSFCIRKKEKIILTSNKIQFDKD